MNVEKIGKFIEARRHELGMTQRELAARLFISSKSVSKWETGRGLPDVSILLELCEILQVKAEELLHGELLKGCKVACLSEDLE